MVEAAFEVDKLLAASFPSERKRSYAFVGGILQLGKYRPNETSHVRSIEVLLPPDLLEEVEAIFPLTSDFIASTTYQRPFFLRGKGFIIEIFVAGRDGYPQIIYLDPAVEYVTPSFAPGGEARPPLPALCCRSCLTQRLSILGKPGWDIVRVVSDVKFFITVAQLGKDGDRLSELLPKDITTTFVNAAENSLFRVTSEELDLLRRLGLTVPPKLYPAEAPRYLNVPSGYYFGRVYQAPLRRPNDLRNSRHTTTKDKLTDVEKMVLSALDICPDFQLCKKCNMDQTFTPGPSTIVQLGDRCLGLVKRNAIYFVLCVMVCMVCIEFRIIGMDRRIGVQQLNLVNSVQE
jgi:hypothetical protein